MRAIAILREAALIILALCITAFSYAYIAIVLFVFGVIAFCVGGGIVLTILHYI